MKRIIILFVFALPFLALNLYARDIVVKYRDSSVDVDSGHFVELNLKPSSFVKEIFYDAKKEYLLVRLKHTFYHYCGIPNSVVSEWVSSTSLGRYYIARVKGNFDCRVNHVPEY